MSELDHETVAQAEQTSPRRRRADRHIQAAEQTAPAQQPAAPQQQAGSDSPLFAGKATENPVRTYNPDLAPLHAQPASDKPQQTPLGSQLDLSGTRPQAQRSEQERKLDFTPTRRPVPRSDSALDQTSFQPSARMSEAMQREPVAEPVAEGASRPRRRWLICLIVLLLVLALLIGGYFLIPENAGGLLGRYRSFVNRFLPGSSSVATVELVAAPAEVLGLNAAPTTGQAPALVNFSITTSTGVEDVRLISDAGNIVSASVTMVPSPGENLTWLISLPIQEPQSLNVTVQYHDGEEWTNYEQYLNLVFE